MNNSPLCISVPNLSRGWAKVMLEIIKPGRAEIAPLVFTVSGFTGGSVHEDPGIRALLDSALAARGMYRTETVASTIFPRSLWSPSRGREVLFDRYASLLPRLKSEYPRNRYGTYFERLTSFESGRRQRRKFLAASQPINQLEHIISVYQAGNHRRSALQATTFDPVEDVNGQMQRGFPCLQQIAFSPLRGGVLAVTAFYAYQHVFEKAYGNYLGLCNLGQFMAHELGLKLGRMTCVAAVAKRDISLSDLGDFPTKLGQLLR